VTRLPFRLNKEIGKRQQKHSDGNIRDHRIFSFADEQGILTCAFPLVEETGMNSMPFRRPMLFGRLRATLG
jgi:hypothetical protein